MPRILIESESSKQLSDGETIRIEASAVRYLRAVLRLRVGDELTLFDGCGTEYEGRIREATTKSVLVEVLGSKRPDREPGRQVFLAQALPKGNKMDFIVQKAVELGCARILPFTSSRTVPAPDSQSGERRIRRWRKIAMEASRQCGRIEVPPVDPIAPFERVLEVLGSCGGYLLWEGADRRLRELTPGAGGPIAIAVGPEGGFTADEAHKARAADLEPVSLGPRILRTDTAGLAGLSIVLYRLEELG